MERSSDKDYQILQYLRDEMTQDERSAFEIELKKDASLREALAFEKDLMQLAQSAGKKVNEYYKTDATPVNEEIDAMIKGARRVWEKEDPIIPSAPGKLKLMKTRINWAVAVALGGIIIVSALYFLNTKDNSRIVNKPKVSDSIKRDPSFPELHIEEGITKENKNRTEPAEDKTRYSISNAERDRLFADNFRPDAVPANIPDLLQEPIIYYESGQYKDAIEAFDNVDQDNSIRGANADKKRSLFYAHYFKSISYLANNNASKAIPGFEKAISQNPGEALVIKAKWYLALANLKMGQFKIADEYLGQLAGTEQAGEYRNRAIELRAEMAKK